MNETVVTLTGTVATDIDHRTSGRGVHIASFRLASAARRSERDETLFVTITCWRQLAENVAGSLARGQPVVVTGRLRVRSREGERGRLVWAEVDAYAVGHDLSLGTAAFRHNIRSDDTAPSAEQEILDDMTVKMAEQFGEDDAAADNPDRPSPERAVQPAADRADAA